MLLLGNAVGIKMREDILDLNLDEDGLFDLAWNGIEKQTSFENLTKILTHANFDINLESGWLLSNVDDLENPELSKDERSQIEQLTPRYELSIFFIKCLLHLNLY